MEVKERKIYIARCVYDGDWWVVNVRGVRAAVTQAKRLEQVEAMAREVISLLLDIPEGSFDVRVEPVLPEEVMPKVREVRVLRREAEHVGKQAANALHETIAELGKQGLSLRDIGSILGLSHQRVAQLRRPHGHANRGRQPVTPPRSTAA